MLYYHKVVRGKAPKNAPTYLPEVMDGKRHPFNREEDRKNGSARYADLRIRRRELPAVFKMPLSVARERINQKSGITSGFKIGYKVDIIKRITYSKDSIRTGRTGYYPYFLNWIRLQHSGHHIKD